jgi:hypothetical protein
VTQNSHRNSENHFEDAPLTPIGSTLTQDVFKAVAILGLAIAAVTFFATRSEHPEQLSRLSYKPPTLTTQISTADVVAPASEAEPVAAVVDQVEPAAIATSTSDSAETHTVEADAVEPAAVEVVVTELAVAEPVQEEAQVHPSTLAEIATSEPAVNAQPNEVKHAAIAPAWNLQRVGMGQVRAYRPPVIAPAIELPPMPQREARTPRLPRGMVLD